MKKKKRIIGFTLLEALIGVTVFIIIATGIYEAYRSVYALIGVTRQKITAIALVNEQLEIIRNLPYADVGIVNGLPAGKIARNQTLIRAGIAFDITTTIRNIDDSFDGTIGGSPNDLSPADYKLAQVDVACSTCKQFQPFSIATYVAPKTMELSSNNGAIFVKLFDANGLPVSGATVHVVNSHVSPAIDINETTNNAGEFALIDVPPGNEAYEISVSKTGYSTEKTYPTTLTTPHPVKANATVTAQQATQISFSIDKLSTLIVAAVDDSCVGLSEIGFQLTGTKLIATEPDTAKYSEEIVTGSDGLVENTKMEWDNYTLVPAVKDVSNYRYFANLPVYLAPDKERKEVVVITPADAEKTYSLLVNVKDGATNSIILDPTLTLTKDAIALPSSLDCAPTDYTLYLGLEPTIYHLVVTAPGYLPFEGDVEVSQSWQEINVVLNK